MRLVGRAWVGVLVLGACGRTIFVDAGPGRVNGDDEPVPPEMVRVTTASGAVLIDRYEASAAAGPEVWGSEDQDTDDDGRIADPEVALAHAASHGLAYDDDGGEEAVVLTTKRARSVADVLPAQVSFYQAAGACTRAGKRLCRPAEWLAACQNGAALTTYPYGDTFDGADSAGADCWTSGLASAAQPTGSASGCATSDGVFDLSGNAQEWVGYDGPDGAEERGGNVAATADNVKCTSVLAGPPGYQFLNLGFRCCKDL